MNCKCDIDCYRKRIAKMKASAKETWLCPEQFFCPGCGEGFRYKCNLSQHLLTCWDYKTKDEM